MKFWMIIERIKLNIRIFDVIYICCERFWKQGKRIYQYYGLFNGDYIIALKMKTDEKFNCYFLIVA
jgi:hypothetical protein